MWSFGGYAARASRTRCSSDGSCGTGGQTATSSSRVGSVGESQAVSAKTQQIRSSRMVSSFTTRHRSPGETSPGKKEGIFHARPDGGLNTSDLECALRRRPPNTDPGTRLSPLCGWRVPGGGFEPPLRDPKSLVLPLDDPGVTTT